MLGILMGAKALFKSAKFLKGLVVAVIGIILVIFGKKLMAFITGLPLIVKIAAGVGILILIFIIFKMMRNKKAKKAQMGGNPYMNGNPYMGGAPNININMHEPERKGWFEK